MRTLELLEDGTIKVPEEFAISKTKRKLHIQTPWMSIIQTMPKGAMQISERMYMRGGTKKPYVPEGHIRIDGIMFKVKKKDSKGEE